MNHNHAAARAAAYRNHPAARQPTSSPAPSPPTLAPPPTCSPLMFDPSLIQEVDLPEGGDLAVVIDVDGVGGFLVQAWPDLRLVPRGLPQFLKSAARN